MWSYTLLAHCSASTATVETWLEGRFGQADERGWVRHGALSFAVRGRGMSSVDFDDQLDGPITIEIPWFIENRGDPDAREEAVRGLFVTVPHLVTEFDASALFLWERDVVYMARVGGEIVIYDRCLDWFRPDVQRFLPPHTVSSEYRPA